MRIAVTTNGASPDSFTDARFLAARYFLIFDTLSGGWDARKLSLWSRHKCGGRVRVRVLAEAGIDTLISRGIDPLSFKALARLGASIYEAPDSSAAEAVQMLQAERLEVMAAPDAVDVARLQQTRPKIN